MRIIGIGIVALVLILAISMTASADPQSPSAEFTNETRYTPAAENHSAVGGNITKVVITGDVLTSKWQGYYGTVSGILTLRDDGGNYMINWTWDASKGGNVLATTNSSPDWSSAFDVAAGSEVDTAWSFTGNDTDSAANTFTDTNKTIKISGTPVGATACAYTYNATGSGIWSTVAVTGLNDTAYKDDYLFAGIMIDSGNSYNDQAVDFQMIVPTPEDGTSEKYEFYIELL